MRDHLYANEVFLPDGTIVPKVLWDDVETRRRKWAELEACKAERDGLRLALQEIVKWRAIDPVYIENNPEDVQRWIALLDTPER